MIAHSGRVALASELTSVQLSDGLTARTTQERGGARGRGAEHIELEGDQRAQIYIVGGAAMSLAYSRERTTRDVDARIDAGHSRLTEAVRTVGRPVGDEGAGGAGVRPGGHWGAVHAPGVLGRRAGDCQVRRLVQRFRPRVRSARDRRRRLVVEPRIQQPVPELFPEEPVKPRARALVEATFRNRNVEYER